MKIEERWTDCIICFVSFYVESNNLSMNRTELSRTIKKTLVFDSVDTDNSTEKIRRYILENFNNVKGIEYIDFYEENALRLI